MGGRGSSSGLSAGGNAGGPGAPAPVRSAADTKDLHELVEYMKTVGPKGIKLNEQSLSGQNFENVKEAASAIEQIAKEFPQAASNIRELQGANLKKGALANASFDGRINLANHYYGKTEDGLAKNYDHSVQNGFHPAGSTKGQIAAHEAGHLLERALIDKYIFSQGYSIYTQMEAVNAWNTSKMSGKVISEACKAAKKTPGGKGLKNADLIRNVSGYATKNRSETLAECVADYHANGANAKPLSVEVWKILKRELG